jgi:ribosomal protein L34
MPTDTLPEDWDILREWLPCDLLERARHHGFLRRARGLEDVELWLRLILMHVVGGLSLEQTVLRAGELGWVELSAVALFKRLRCAQPWLADLTAYLLAEQQRRLAQAAWPRQWNVRLIDASDIHEPGSTGTSWRLHYSLQLPQMVCDHFELTDARGGEKLARFAFAKGQLVIADRGYSNRAGLAHVLRAGAEVLVRWNPATLPLEDSSGGPFQALAWLSRLRVREPRERTVYFRHEGERFALRLCALRKGKLATERSQDKARRKALRNGRCIEPTTLEFARYVMVLCSSAAEALSTSDALNLYRGRWQVELAFKRLKTLLDAGHVPKRNDASARAWMQAKVLSALLLERILWEGEFLSPWGYGSRPGQCAEPLAPLP